LDYESNSRKGSEFTNIPYTSCNLGSIDISSFVVQDFDPHFNFDTFKEAVKVATRYLNNVIDVNEYPIKKIEEVTKSIRPIGLGMMGIAHALYLLRIPYNSEEAYDFIDQISYLLTITSMWESVAIAKENGKSYPAFDYDTFVNANARFLNNEPGLQDAIATYGIANSCNTSIAPTGSISFIANRSGGIEPVYALSFARRIEKLNRDYETVYITDPIFEAYLSKTFDADEKIKILERVSNNKGSCQNILEIPEHIRKVFVVASDITPMEHLEFLGSAAKNISTSISKTINLPSSATVEEISEVYKRAYKLGIIGVTVYRDGCRDGILMSVDDAKKLNGEKDTDTQVKKGTPIKRPRVLDGKIYQLKEDDAEYKTYCTLSYYEQDGDKIPWEMFLFSSSKNHEWYTAIGRLASKLMRRTGDIKEVIDELKAIKGDNGFLTKEYGYVYSRPYYLACVLEDFSSSIGNKVVDASVDKCPKCGELTLIREGGCSKCTYCGYDKCGS
jgi:ribonucleoside-diphosphate reductase alpha chain